MVSVTQAQLAKELNVHPDTLRTYFKIFETEEAVRDFCCKDKKERRRILREKTCLEKYGYRSANRNKDVQAKRKQSLEKKYGSIENYYAHVSKESEKTKLEKYGNSHYVNREKASETNLKRYGVKSPLQNKEIAKNFSDYLLTKDQDYWDARNEKLKQTNLEKYGKEWYASTEESILYKKEHWKNNPEKSKQTRLERYGSYNPSDFQKKVADSWSKKSEEERADISRKRSSHRWVFDGEVFDSSWELYFYIFHKDQHHNIQRCTKLFSYSENKTYNPDFEIDGELFEIKGPQFVKEDGSWQCPYDHSLDNLYEEKHQCALKNNVHIISLQEIQPIIEWVDKKYTKDFVPLFEVGIPFPYPSKLSKSENVAIRYFHKSINWATRKGKPSSLQAWENKDLVLKSALNRLKYIGKCDGETIIQGFNVAKIAPKVSVFKPSIGRKLLKTYASDYNKIIDPFSGFSGRLIAATSLGKTYVGRDISEDHIKESKELANYLKLKNWELRVEDLLKKEGQEEADCLFTCPPYGGKEHWNKNSDEMEKPCDEWIDLCLEKYKCEKYIFVVDETKKYKDYIAETLETKTIYGDRKEYVIVI